MPARRAPGRGLLSASIAVYRAKLGELDTLIEQLRSVRAQVGAQLARAEAELPGGPEPLCELTHVTDGGEHE